MQNLEPQTDVNSSGEHLFLLLKSSYGRYNHQSNQRLNWFKLGFSHGELSDFRLLLLLVSPSEVQTERVKYLLEPVFWWAPKFKFHSLTPCNCQKFCSVFELWFCTCSLSFLQIGKCLVDKMVHFPAHLFWPGSWPFKSLLLW